MFKQRLITALWALPLVTVVVWFGEPWFTILVALVGLAGAWEFYRMAATKARPLTYFGLLWTLLFILSPHIGYYRAVPPLLASGIMLSLIWLIVIRHQHEEAFTGWAWKWMFRGRISSFRHANASRSLPMCMVLSPRLNLTSGPASPPT